MQQTRERDGACFLFTIRKVYFTEVLMETEGNRVTVRNRCTYDISLSLLSFEEAAYASDGEATRTLVPWALYEMEKRE